MGVEAAWEESKEQGRGGDGEGEGSMAGSSCSVQGCLQCGEGGLDSGRLCLAKLPLAKDPFLQLLLLELFPA